MSRISIAVSQILLALLASIAHAPAAAGQRAEQGAFAILVGADTFAVETFTRYADRVEGEITGRAVGRLGYTMWIDGSAGVPNLTLRYWGPTADLDGPPVQEADLAVVADTVVLQITNPPGIDAQRIPSRAGAFIYVNPSFVMAEQMVLHARARGSDSVDFPVFMAQGEDTAAARVSLAPGDTALVTILGSVMRLVMDEQGRLASAAIPAQGVTVVRTQREDL